MPPIVEPWVWGVMTIAQEALGEPLEGKIAVAEVIRNRMRTEYNSDGSIEDTVLRPYQFSGWNTGKYRVQIAKLDLGHPDILDCIRAFSLAFDFETNHAKGANLYHASTMAHPPSWVNSPKVERLVQIGHHIFYKETR